MGSKWAESGEVVIIHTELMSYFMQNRLAYLGPKLGQGAAASFMRTLEDGDAWWEAGLKSFRARGKRHSFVEAK